MRGIRCPISAGAERGKVNYVRTDGVRPDSIRLFTEGPGSRAENDAANRAREAAIEALLEKDPRRRELLKSDSGHGPAWSLLEAKLRTAIDSVTSRLPNLGGADFTFAEPKGGRHVRYDLVLKFLQGTDEIAVKAEFKRGPSIYHQPQFLSLYAKSGTLTSAVVPSYAEFFYDGYIDELVALVGPTNTPAPDRATYLQKVYSNDSTVHPFFRALYEDHPDLSREPLRKGLAARSGNDYLAMLEATGPTAINWDVLEAGLEEQAEKVFISWDTSEQTFVIEQFAQDQVKLLRDFVTKAGRDGNRRYVVIENEAGGSIHAMLRWRNHYPVQLPAWQISMKAN
jgi:hypothetical protein